MSDYDEVPLEDPQLLEEIELLGNLMVAASSTDVSLSQTDIDQALGVSSAPINIPGQRPPACG